MSSRKKGRWQVGAEDIFAVVVELMLKAGAVVFILCLIYILAGLFQGHISRPQSDAALQRAVAAVRLVGNITMVSASLLTVGLVLRFFEMRQMGIYLLIAGVAVWFGFPFLMELISGGVRNQAMDYLATTFNTTSIILLGAGIIRLVIAVVERIIEGPPVQVKTERQGRLTVKPKEVVKKMRYHALSPCWKLPYCSESMARICPVFQQKRTCWRMGRGCQCDPILIETLVGGMAVQSVDPSKGMVTVGEIAGLDEVERIRRRWKAAPKIKPPCERCSIFMLHQQLKHQVLSPLAFILAPAIVYFARNYFDQAYITLVQWINDVWIRISYVPVQASADPTGLLSTPAKIILAVILCFYLVVYITRLIEYCVFKLQL